MAWPIVAKGIEVRDEMPQLAVRLNQIFGLNPRAGLARVRLIRTPEPAGQARRPCPAVPAPRPAPRRFKSCKKCLPVWIYRTRVRLVLLVQPVDVIRIRSIDDVKRFHK